MSDTTSTYTHDLVWGAAKIAEAINLNIRQTFHLLETGKLPARKIGARWVASRQALIKFVLGEAA